MIDLQIDHLVYTASSLALGMDKIEELLGVRPVLGGRHANWGTHNAILSLGSAYLEVIAPCPELTTPEQGPWLEDFYDGPPHLATWAVQTKDISTLQQIVRNRPIPLGKIQQGERKKANGELMQWQLTDPYLLAMEGAMPFFIDWGETSHPSTLTTQGGELIELHIEHPQAEKLKQHLDSLDVEVFIHKGKRKKITAHILRQDKVVAIC